MTTRSVERSLASIVAGARRRANRHVAFEALATAITPAAALVAAWLIAARLGAPAPGTTALAAIGALALVGAAALFRHRRLDDPGAALLLDRRAGLDERCVTGLRTGGAIAADALERLASVDVARALAFRPPRPALAAALGVIAVAGLALAGEGPRGGRDDGVRSVVVLSGGTAGGGEDEPAKGVPAALDAPPLPDGVSALDLALEQAGARLGPEHAAAIEEIRRAIAAGDDEAARAALERLLNELRPHEAEPDQADPDETGPGSRGAAHHVEEALQRLPAPALRGGATEAIIDWDAADRDLIRRWRRALRAAGK